MSTNNDPIMQQMPLKMVGSTVFGRYPMISVEETFNMIMSDNGLAPYAGYRLAQMLNSSGKGRGVFKSVRLNKLVVVIEEVVYLVNTNLSFSQIGALETFSGDVFIDENDNKQIAICDKSAIWVYDYNANTFTKSETSAGVALDFRPGYVAFQDGYMISVDLNNPQWRLSEINNAKLFPNDSQHVGGFQTKPDIPIAALRIPGKGNLLFIFGSTVIEPWYDIGAQLFPYQKSSGTNVDYGCINPDTIATLDEIVCWVGVNEKSAPVIMYSTGGKPEQISTDGINYRLANLTHPEDCHGFMFKQDGHLIYQFTFERDNVSYIYDFETQKFFTITDPYMNYHIAKKVTYFNNKWYFISLNDGNLYEFGTNISEGNGKELPRIRVCPTLRAADTQPFITNQVSFLIEQGVSGVTEEIINGELVTNYPRVDMSISTDGGYTFGSYDGMSLNRIGLRRNRFAYYGLGWSNEITPQFRMFSQGRFVCGDGILDYYQ